MELKRTSRDFESLKAHMKTLASQSSNASVPRHYLEWIHHLITLKAMLAIDPSLAGACSWEEIQGLVVMQEATDAVSRMKSCPRCGAKTDALFDCPKCGMRLTK
jgi:hypothetical protein